jgi:hypothetical protein
MGEIGTWPVPAQYGRVTVCFRGVAGGVVCVTCEGVCGMRGTSENMMNNSSGCGTVGRLQGGMGRVVVVYLSQRMSICTQYLGVVDDSSFFFLAVRLFGSFVPSFAGNPSFAVIRAR